MKTISKPAICSLILGIIFTALAVIINGGILYAMIAAGLFVSALSLQICRTKPIVCTCFNLLLYVIALIDFLFIGTVKHAVLIDVLLICIFSAIHIQRKKGRL